MNIYFASRPLTVLLLTTVGVASRAIPRGLDNADRRVSIPARPQGSDDSVPAPPPTESSCVGCQLDIVASPTSATSIQGDGATHFPEPAHRGLAGGTTVQSVDPEGRILEISTSSSDPSSTLTESESDSPEIAYHHFGGDYVVHVANHTILFSRDETEGQVRYWFTTQASGMNLTLSFDHLVSNVTTRCAVSSATHVDTETNATYPIHNAALDEPSAANVPKCSVWLAIGGTIAGTALLAMLIFATLYLRRRHRRLCRKWDYIKNIKGGNPFEPRPSFSPSSASLSPGSGPGLRQTLDSSFHQHYSSDSTISQSRASRPSCRASASTSSNLPSLPDPVLAPSAHSPNTVPPECSQTPTGRPEMAQAGQSQLARTQTSASGSLQQQQKEVPRPHWQMEAPPPRYDAAYYMDSP